MEDEIVGKQVRDQDKGMFSLNRQGSWACDPLVFFLFVCSISYSSSNRIFLLRMTVFYYVVCNEQEVQEMKFWFCVKCDNG